MEWCLYGDECIGEKFGIRERVGTGEMAWRVVSNNSKKTRVKLEIEGEQGGFTIIRIEVRERGKEGKNIKISMPDGTEKEVNEADQEIAKLLRISFKSQYETQYKHLKSKEKGLRDFERENGNKYEIDNKIRKVVEEIEAINKEIKQNSPKAELIEEGISILESAAPSDTEICPLCGEKVSNLLEHLRKEWEEKIKAQVQELEKQQAELDKKKTDFEKLKTEHIRLDEDTQREKERLKEAEEKIDSARSAIDYYFRRITNNPAFQTLNIKVEEDKKTGGNFYIFEDWILAKIPMDEIPTGEMLIESLRPHRMKDLEMTQIRFWG